LKTNKLARRTVGRAAHFRLVNIAHSTIIPVTSRIRAHCSFTR
jgi:hypothetical protein